MAKIYVNRKEIEQDVKDIILEVLVTATEQEVVPNVKLGGEGLGADRLDIMEITMHLEKTFGISITDYQQNEMATYTVSEICDMVEKKI